MNTATVRDMPRGFDQSGMSSGINFYHWPTNIASQRCMLVLEEKGKLPNIGVVYWKSKM
jgi:hypothetical protein